MAETALPKLSFPCSRSWSVQVTAIESERSVVIVLLGEEYSTALASLKQDLRKDTMQSVEEVELDCVYVTDLLDRLQVDEILETGECECYLLDVGTVETVPKSRLRHTSLKVLELPGQAFSVDLHGFERFSCDGEEFSHVVDRLAGYLENNSFEAVVANQAEVEGAAAAGRQPRPSLTLYDNSIDRRGRGAEVGQNNFSLDVNSLLLDILWYDSANSGPRVPLASLDIADLAEVTIPLAFSPSYFTVQPRSKLAVYQSLQADLTTFYNCCGSLPALTVTRLNKGWSVAVKDQDIWFRARVVAPLDTMNTMVRLYDAAVGNLFSVSNKNIRKLLTQFCKLPAGAVNARIGKVMPANGDWEPLDEDFWKERVENKEFVCEVLLEWKDKDGNDGVEVVLYDTSCRDVDMVPHIELVELGRARSISV